MAMNLFLVRLDGNYVRYTGVVTDPVFVDMTGKGEPYRDLPSLVGADVQSVGTGGLYTGKTNTGLQLNAPSIVPSSGSLPPYLTGTVTSVDSDDVAHLPPRQGSQEYTMWKFDLGVSVGNPQYLYAEFRRGDMVANTAPNTDPAA